MLLPQPQSEHPGLQKSCQRLKKDWGYMIWQHKSLNMETFKKGFKGSPQACFKQQHGMWWLLSSKKGSRWLKALSSSRGLVVMWWPQRAKIFQNLLPITTKYGSEHYLAQNQHESDTQSNESLNQSQACLTPKSKVIHELYPHFIIGTWFVLVCVTGVMHATGLKFSTASSV